MEPDQVPIANNFYEYLIHWPSEVIVKEVINFF